MNSLDLNSKQDYRLYANIFHRRMDLPEILKIRTFRNSVMLDLLRQTKVLTMDHFQVVINL